MVLFYGKMNDVNKKKSGMKSTTKNITYIAMAITLMAVCSWITIPMTVPITMQTFAVFTIVALFGLYRGTIAVLLYIFLGAVGLPLFSNFGSGFGYILSNTGGYLLGFVFSALIIGTITKFFGNKTFVLILAMTAGLLVCYIFGTVWFMYLYTKNSGSIALVTVLTWCVFPFIIPDALKIALSVIVVKRLSKYVKLN